MSFDRRSILKLGALGAGALSFGGLTRPVLAQSEVRRRLVFAYFEGGWDILLGLDPREPQGNDPNLTRIDPAYDQLPEPYRSRGIQTRNGLRFGPAVPTTFLAHAQDMTIVNGVGMDTAAHDAGRRYFITGRFPRGVTAVGSSAAAEIVSVQGDHTAIPHMSAGVEAYAQALPNHASPFTVNSLADLQVALNPIVAVEPEVVAAVRAFHDRGPSCEAERMDGTGLVTQLEENRLRARAYLEDQLGQLFDLARQDGEMQALRNLYGIVPGSPQDGPEVLAFVAGQALKNDLTQAVSVRVARGLDTHSNWAADQPPRQEQGFAALASLITDLKNAPLPEDPSRSLFEETTIVAFSEFGRTPLLNDLAGRDHHLGNSCLLAGAGIRTGRTVGASASVGMLPIATDPQSGVSIERPSESQMASGAAVMMSPAHILTTVFETAGLSTDILRSTSISALMS
ncbi:MAG: DUF1501 domain-containing protein [Myxococcota bacterium]